MISGILRVRVFLGNRREQKDAPLEVRRSFSVAANGDIHMVVGPVGRRRDRLFIAQLECLDATDNLIGVPTHAGRIVQREHELVFGVDDKDGSDCQREVLLVACSGVNHPVGGTDGPVGIADDREFDLDVALAMGDDVLEPFRVGLDGIDREGGDQAVHGLQLVVLEGQPANLGRADGCV